jgi:hypothetical protein
MRLAEAHVAVSRLAFLPAGIVHSPYGGAPHSGDDTSCDPEVCAQCAFTVSQAPPLWRPTTFSKNHERLLYKQEMGKFLEKLMADPKVDH